MTILGRLKPRDTEPLVIYRFRGVRLLGRYVPLWYVPVSVILGLLVLFCWLGEIILILDGTHSGEDSGTGAFFTLSVIPLAPLIVLTKLAFSKPRVN